MKVGARIYATDQGLGIMAKQFFDHGIIDYVSIQPHGSRENHFDWYPHNLSEEELLAKSDVILFFETPFNWKLIPRARERGVKTVLMPMYECTRNPLTYVPDLLLNNSLLEQRLYPEGKLVACPVDETWRLRKKALCFVHNAGNGGLGGRNGTKELLEAMPMVESPIRLIIRSQALPFKSNDSRVEIRLGTAPRETLYDEGDVFIFPEKFAGCSMPMQEAYASGMMIMCSNRFPSNKVYPVEPMIPVSGYRKERINIEFDSAIVNSFDIARTIDAWYGKDISKFSLAGKEWGEMNDWKTWKPIYKQILKDLHEKNK